MNKFRALTIAAGLAVSSFGASSAYAGVSIDGSFEDTGGLTTTFSVPGADYKTGSDSTLPNRPFSQNLVFGPSVSVVASNGSAFGFANAPAGNTVAILQGVGSSITTAAYGLIFGAVYQVVFSAQGRPGGYGVNPINVSVGGGGSRPNGQDLGTFTPTTSGFTSFTTNVFKFVGGGSNALTFTGAAPGPYAGTQATDYASAFDNVSLNLISAPTPEPEAYLSMVLGLGLAGAIARRRAKKAAAAA